MKTNRILPSILGLAGVALFALALARFVRNRTSAEEAPLDAIAPAYVGVGICAECHAAEVERWSGSHHDLAIQVANDETVLGDFGDATFEHRGVATRFYRRDRRFLVLTEGPDGKTREYEVAYTFGVSPIQQYLIEFGRGRYQALGIAWDSRPPEAGGGRWFHLYPERSLEPGSPLHWTGIDQTWNHMCAACHSTALEKTYDASTDSYATTWAEIDVACEACHGPGSEHVAWAQDAAAGERSQHQRALPVQFPQFDPAVWEMEAERSIARRRTPLTSRIEIETCAPCHSRRSALSVTSATGRPLMDSHRPALLEPGLYHADGQVLDEVYVYGSFLQSQMYRAGVTCSDCHDPHSLRLRAEGNAVCTRCHLPSVFDTQDHHFHPDASAGASCTDCHMPARTFMVVDPRRDHSMRVPRPDLSQKLGTPNACNDCHADRSFEWAAAVIARRYGEREREPHYGEALHAVRVRALDARDQLLRLAADPTMPGVARATALTELGRYPTPHPSQAVIAALANRDPLVRLGALGALQQTEPRVRVMLAAPLLDDSIRAVRLEAASLLSDAPASALSVAQQSALERGTLEYGQIQLNNLDRPEAHMNLGAQAARRGDVAESERAYREAIRIDPSFVPVYINLADLYRLQQRDADGEEVLRGGLEHDPQSADLHHALGLALVRLGRRAEALEELGRASELGPDEPRYAYVYAIALHSEGRSAAALSVLDGALREYPGDVDLLWGATAISRDTGALDSAASFARRLQAANPDDPRAAAFLAEVQRER